jgi:large subunit ribosomal protein L3
MANAMIGKKLGMTRIFDEKGYVVPVTVIQAEPNVVVQRKTTDKDGYDALQVGIEKVKRSRVNSPLTGHFGAARVEPLRHLREVPCGSDDAAQPGDEVKVDDVFKVGQVVKVTGMMKGRGFAGGIKRHGFHGGPAAHGSKVHRAPQSTGATDAARVFPGTRKPGHMGACRRTTRGLKIVKIDSDRNLLLIRGAVPGANGGLVTVTLEA